MATDQSDTFSGPVPPAPETPAVRPSRVTEQLPRPTCVGRYQVQCELGRGGIGVVYRAYDRNLKRTVALKMLLAGRWHDDGAYDRFRSEAEASARLSHRNIVRVFEAGQADDRPFLVMELIDSPTLAAVLATAPLPPAAAARLVGDLAEAVAHAHTAGVVHRDLKPANILLEGACGTRLDRDGCPAAVTPKIADFGLAKLADDDHRQTRTGVVVGTPSYMAPEQAAGGPAGAAPGVDVYALGAILYECLTGRPPFQAATALDTLALVRTADPVPPRRLQPQVPRDLEVICLHCLEKAPGRRYPTAAALLDDLRRFRDGRAIAARPVGAAGRVARWGRRNPAAAGLIALGAATVVAVTAGVTWHNVRLQRALDAVTHQEAETRTARDQADANYRHAQGAIERILGRLGDKEFVGVPKMKELRRRQQEDALAFALAIAAQSGDSPDVQFDTARALFTAAMYQRGLDREAEAGDNFRAAADRFTALADRFPDDPKFRRWQASALLQLWPSFAEAGDLDAAERVVREVIGLRERLHAADPDAPAEQSELAQAHANLGNLALLRKRPADAESAYRRAAELHRAAVATAPRVREYKDRLASTLVNLSVITQQQPSRFADTERDHAEAVRWYEELVRDDPADSATLYGLAILRANWAYVLIGRNEFDRALADLGETLRAVEPARRQEPDDIKLKDAAYRTNGVMANLYESRQDWAAAVRAWRKVLDTAPADKRLITRLMLALALARAGDHATAAAEAAGAADELPPTAPAEPWAHLATVVAIARSKGPAGAADGYARLAARMLARVKATSDPKMWPAELQKLMIDPDLAPVFAHPEVRAAVGLSPP